MAASRQRTTAFEAFKEERAWFRSFGWNDKQIAERLGIEWTAYRRRFLRHPELGPICDPEEEERQRWASLGRALFTYEKRKTDAENRVRDVEPGSRIAS